MPRTHIFSGLAILFILFSQSRADDYMRQLQSDAIASGKASFGHWGVDPDDYTNWTSHSNRLIPVYAYGTKAAGDGIDLNDYRKKNSPYRSEDSLRRIYGRLPEQTVNANATWMDQTNIADIQRAAIQAGRRYVFLVVFDGMDWDTTRAAAIYNQKAVTYVKGKGTGTHFQEYKAHGTAQFGLMVTSPHNEGTDVDVDQQTVKNPGGKFFGGYNAQLAGTSPWDTPSDMGYLIAKPADGHVRHAYTDSSSSATSMTVGTKTYNNAITVDFNGEPLSAIAHEVQADGWAVGVVSSVPISHATPASAYAHNVHRNDYQDISRDMLGLPSVFHPETPLPGLDVVIGGGYGTLAETSRDQGKNFEAGNQYLAGSDLEKVSTVNGGRYVTAVRAPGQCGSQRLAEAAALASHGGHRLLGFYGMGQYNGHLPFQTADGNFDPAPGVKKKAEEYTAADLNENPNLAEMTTAALTVLESRKTNFWLMVEAGDVDWANHDNNIDCSIGAVNSGDAAVKVLTDWVEANSNWQESLMIITADHGHLLNLTHPELLAGPPPTPNSDVNAASE
ncbi:MAG: alkaline phosphatase [Planctomycetaceae bacterium]